MSKHDSERKKYEPLKRACTDGGTGTYDDAFVMFNFGKFDPDSRGVLDKDTDEAKEHQRPNKRYVLRIGGG